MLFYVLIKFVYYFTNNYNINYKGKINVKLRKKSK